MSNNKKIHNKDVHERINYLHQASKIISNKNPNLACFYGNLMKQLQKKAVLKVDRSIKRDFCKRCSKPVDSTTDFRVDDDQNAFIECSKCGFEKKYPIK